MIKSLHPGKGLTSLDIWWMSEECVSSSLSCRFEKQDPQDKDVIFWHIRVIIGLYWGYIGVIIGLYWVYNLYWSLLMVETTYVVCVGCCGRVMGAPMRAAAPAM